MYLILTTFDDNALRAAATRTVWQQCHESGKNMLSPQCCIELMVLMGRAVAETKEVKEPRHDPA
jgi:hypothetical protein